VVTVQRTFRAQYANDPPIDKTIRARYNLLKLGVCVCVEAESTHVDACVGQELAYRIDVCPVTRGAHIEHL